MKLKHTWWFKKIDGMVFKWSELHGITIVNVFILSLEAVFLLKIRILKIAH